jgi:hypothetical protein
MARVTPFQSSHCMNWIMSPLMLEIRDAITYLPGRF